MRENSQTLLCSKRQRLEKRVERFRAISASIHGLNVFSGKWFWILTFMRRSPHWPGTKTLLPFKLLPARLHASDCLSTSWSPIIHSDQWTSCLQLAHSEFTGCLSGTQWNQWVCFGVETEPLLVGSCCMANMSILLSAIFTNYSCKHTQTKLNMAASSF